MFHGLLIIQKEKEKKEPLHNLAKYKISALEKKCFPLLGFVYKGYTFCRSGRHTNIFKCTIPKTETGIWKPFWAGVCASVPAARLQGCRVLGQKEVDHPACHQLLATGVLRGGLRDHARDCHPQKEVAGCQEPGRWHHGKVDWN